VTLFFAENLVAKCRDNAAGSDYLVKAQMYQRQPDEMRGTEI
jgi:hypothetical protein